MAKKRSPGASKGKPSKAFKQKTNKKGGKSNPSNFRKRKTKESEEFEVSSFHFAKKIISTMEGL